MLKKYSLLVLIGLYLVSCKKEDPELAPDANNNPIVAAFHASTERNPPIFTSIAGRINKINNPQDLDFHSTRPNELWVINKGTENTGGSTVTITNAGLNAQQTEWRRDGNAWHFMALPSAISFSKTNENFGTSSDILDANRQNGTFAGPTLWSSDMNVYAQDPGPGLNGSHLDMLHGSPYSLGIESDEDNAFWVFDAYNGHIAWYDFATDHGPGHDDHSDGIVYRYTEIPLHRNTSGIPSHIVEDDETAILFVCDTENSRILWMNTLSGQLDRSLPLDNEPLASHQQMKNLEWGVFSDENLKKPCGIEVQGNILYVSDYETGEIIAYDKESKIELSRIDTGEKGIAGIKMDSQGKLWYVNSLKNTVVRIDPK